MRAFLAVLAMAAALSPAATARAADPVLIFGGNGHRVFLGCLTCNQFDRDSVWNDMSRYGWDNGFATWNPFGPYKNPFGSHSACNRFAMDPPVLVDRRGTYYGRLSVNSLIAGSICGLRGNADICTALKVMCASR